MNLKFDRSRCLCYATVQRFENEIKHTEMSINAMINYHTHTRRCRHAEGTDRAYVEAAIRAGYSEIGFSDHAPMLFPDGYYSGFRMFPQEAEGYVNSILALREEYKSEITIKCGFELEYYPALFRDTLHFLQQYPIDYFILGQHYTKNEYEQDAHYSGSPTADESILEQYISQVLAGLSTGVFSYPAHPDLIHFTGDTAVYEAHMTRFCEEIKNMGYPLELNFLGFQKGRNYPNELFWQIAAKVGNDVIIGLDAHTPKSYANKHTLQKMKKWAKHLGITPNEQLVLQNPHSAV